MLRVTVELVPFGDEARKKKLGAMVIGNIGSSYYGNKHDYAVVYNEPSPLAGEPVEKAGVLIDYDRRASVWTIILAALERLDPPVRQYEKKMLEVCKEKL